MSTPSQEDQAKKVLKAMKIASNTVREAIANAIPVASNQVLTVAVPGTIINWKDFYYDADEQIKTPTAVRAQEARLADGMIPLSKFTAGKTGKSVARSYLAALDLLVPIEASVSGVIGNAATQVTDDRLKVIRDRYKASMDYLKSGDDSPGSAGKSKVETYVAKQSAWAKEVAAYDHAQGQALKDFAPPQGSSTAQVKESREKYMQWLQENARAYKNNIQAKYMDWVVHGYKFMVDFHFGVVDISSGMKRIENSKEAYRNLTIVADDGASEYNGVVLTPSHWATIIRDKVRGWKKRNDKPMPAEIRVELRRLQNLLASHETLKQGIEQDAFFPVAMTSSNTADDNLKRAYAEVYANMDDKNYAQLQGTRTDKTAWLSGYRGSTTTNGQGQNEDHPAEGTTESPSADPLTKLVKAQAAWNDAGSKRSAQAVRSGEASIKDTAKSWLDARIGQLSRDIADLEKQLSVASGTAGKMLALPVVNQEGIVISDSDIAVNPELVGKKNPNVGEDGEEADPWTKISCKASSNTDIRETSTSQSASSIAAKANWCLFSASGGASHTESSAKAMQSMANLDVEMTMDCMVVEIERPWLHAELFADAELDSGRFDISPGEARLKQMYENEEVPAGYYQQFSSYPTAFVVAADVELSFSGDTSALESAVSASSTSANVSVGYGPFAVSASRSQSKSNSKTKMQSTATGCKISIQAPQIVGWVQTLLPQLPRPRDGASMVGMFN
ncbi:hypothetical protein B0T26DRAFT_755616 [Lasiosphaeria miniovina]|uniref:Uncharacterized protein n=1 Tax=Lasiosphaeria miniovina TaxID=1954250 RepID=A0AA40DJN6_9PEZI|nr:uncharacterized protein B0T26DRAFT_755616 [Lasiosphaeria miniovina]KAK0706084.1 hypothetical protein B0T26DRAFT_755616 [Lasiosphaeria miniovina]